MAARLGQLVSPTTGLCPGYLQANIVMLEASVADDFLEFCLRNPKPCPLLYVTEPGQWDAPDLAFAAKCDIRTDVPMYRVYRNGKLELETPSVESIASPTMRTFFLGCSFSFENALQEAGVPVRNLIQNRNVSMYNTNVRCEGVGPFHTTAVVSMRPIPQHLVNTAVEITRQMPEAHGDPIHIGDASVLGIQDINTPDYGDPVAMEEGDVPVFWACGVTSTRAAASAELPLVITHSPGYMFVSDLPNAQSRPQFEKATSRKRQ
eukprot:c12589_g1_i1.p1 GENE.c12589_g1_i1~~c12589_g1_i1.p1  ORF type:complete len:284 (+),score=51.35 c12589_g1_i1:64-852(+)